MMFLMQFLIVILIAIMCVVTGYFAFNHFKNLWEAIVDDRPSNGWWLTRNEALFYVLIEAFVLIFVLSLIYTVLFEGVRLTGTEVYRV